MRYQNAADLRADLQRLTRDLESGRRPALAAAARPPARRHRWVLTAIGVAVLALALGAVRYAWLPGRGQAIDSVAVLPFANVDGGADSEYLSDGITESLIRDLSQVQSLKVTARSRVFRYRGKDVDPQAIGRELSVRAVLSGRLLQRGDMVVVRTELMDVSDGSQLWGGEYRSKTTSLFELQSNLSREISEKLRLRLTPGQRQRLTKRPTENNDAYRLYLQGRYQWNKKTRDGVLKAISDFTQAIDKDPTYALAYAALADAYSFASFSNAFPPRDIMPNAEAAATRALEIDPDLADAHISLGYASFTYDWDWSAAVSHFERARALNRAVLESHPYYAFYLTVSGRHEEAIRTVQRAVEADPTSASLSHTLSVQLSLAGRFEDGINECRRTIDLDPNFALALPGDGLRLRRTWRVRRGAADRTEGRRTRRRQRDVSGANRPSAGTDWEPAGGAQYRAGARRRGEAPVYAESGVRGRLRGIGGHGSGVRFAGEGLRRTVQPPGLFEDGPNLAKPPWRPSL